jgi:CheY-like chemotaxis protein
LAPGGSAALALVAEQQAAGLPGFDAICVDWQMPGMDGWETLARIKDSLPAGAAAPKPPVMLMVTANGRDLLAQRSAPEQALLHAFLVKPVTAAMLQEAVQGARSGRGNVRSRSRAHPAQARRLLGMRLLVVEDNLINQQVASELLRAEGAEVQLANNGQLGVDAVAQAQPPFDAVLMDLQMPVMDGFAATHCIRKDLGFAQLPIIAMTANAMASDREECLAAGMNAHVGKPFDLSHLVQVLLQQTGRLADATALPDSAAPDAADALPHSSTAFDFDAALERMGRDQELFDKVLQAFRAEVAGVPERLQACLNAPDMPAALALLHTLKGLSATVGARHLSAVARAAELALQTDTPAEHKALGQRLRVAVEHTLLHLDQLLATRAGRKGPTPRTPGPAPADRLQLLAQLQLLQGLLASADLHALEAFEALRRMAPASLQSQLEPLEQAIAELDFARASSACAALQRAL